jgi:hypothetical protein
MLLWVLAEASFAFSDDLSAPQDRLLLVVFVIATF